MRRPVFTADDFGLTQSVNEAVERAHRTGILHAASLLVAGPAVADAVQRARAMPRLSVGLHLVVIEGPAVLPPTEIPDLVNAQGWFSSDQLRLGINYALRARIRRQLAAEIRAQFAAFAATGLALHHADAHKHMHLHPVVGRMMLDIGREFGLSRVRVPAEPPAVLARCGTRVGLGARAMYRLTHLLRRQVRAAGMATSRYCFGIAWSGHLTTERVRRLLVELPHGESEIYFHPAVTRDALLRRLMPDYAHDAELAALVDPAVVRLAIETSGVNAQAAPEG
jgi:hopanoid biosynthesis associated protein HpnK